MKKAVSILLSILMVLTMMPAMAWAGEGETGGSSIQNRRLMMSDVKITSENFQTEKGNLHNFAEIEDGAAIEKYIYWVGVDDSGTECVQLYELPSDIQFKSLYLKNIIQDENGEQPEFDEDCQALSMDKVQNETNQYRFSLDMSSVEDGLQRFEVMASSESCGELGNLSFKVKEKADQPEQEPAYEFVYPEDTCNFYVKDEKGQYLLLKEENGVKTGDQIPCFFEGEESQRLGADFYVIRKKDSSQRPELKLYELIAEIGNFQRKEATEGQFGISDDADIADEQNQDYWVWKVTVNSLQAESKIRLGLQFSDQNENNADRQWRNLSQYLWVVGENYIMSNVVMAYDQIIALSKSPERYEWDTPQDLADQSIYNCSDPHRQGQININLSKEPTDEDNSFYILYSGDKNLDAIVTRYHAFANIEGSAVGTCMGGEFEEMIDSSVLEIKELGNLSELYEDWKYEGWKIARVNLKAFQGKNNLRITFRTGDIMLGRVELVMGMNIKITGDMKGFKEIKDSNDLLHEALGFSPITGEMEMEEGADFVTVFYDKAYALYDGTGQGNNCQLNVILKPGYVIDSITDINGKPYNFGAWRTYFYEVTDKDGIIIDTPEERQGTGWEAVSGSSGDGKPYKEAFRAQHLLAASGDGHGEVGYETVSDFVSFLYGTNSAYSNERAPFTARHLLDYTDTNIILRDDQGIHMNEIVVHISKPKFGDKIACWTGTDTNHAKINAEQKTVDGDWQKKAEQILGKLDYKDAKIEKVYEIETNDGSEVEGFVNVTIPAGELVGEVQDYVVMYFPDDTDTPVEVPTTYVEGEGIVFTTGHFSTYAIVRIGNSSTGEETTDDSEDSTEDNVPSYPWIPPVTDTLASVKKEEKAALQSYLDVTEFEEAETEMIQKILSQAEEKIEDAKTETEIQAVVEQTKQELDKLETAEEKKLIDKVKKYKFRASSSQTTLNGKRAIRITWTVPKGETFEGYEVFRSTSRYKGFGTKPFFTTEKTSYINNKQLKKGTRYYYKVRAYKFINDEKVYTDWSYKAWRTVR